jgi:N-acyl-D-amino-acid deacylase
VRLRRLVLTVAALFTVGATPAPPPADLLIRGGTVFTGSGAPFTGDVAVSGDRILAVGRRLHVSPRRTIDARGMIVAPGFIDPHTHAAEQLASDDSETRLVPAFLMQGVTTAFIGNDGRGATDAAVVLGAARRKPVGVNYATFVGLDPVRRQVVGEADRPPTAAELDLMQALVADAMCAGALGFSTGLFYAPQSFARTDEIVALAREAALRGGVYDSHIRDESTYSVGLAAAIGEALEIGRRAGLPVNISHLKALGVDVHGQAPAIVAMVEAAQSAGQKVTADQYPWSASGTRLVASLVPTWAQEGGRAALLARLDDPSLAHRLRSDMAENLRRRGGPDALLVTEGDHRGKTLADIAGTRGENPVVAAIAVIRVADPAVVSFSQTEEDIADFMRRPWVMTGSDASPGHPRAFGSFARKYREYVVRRKVIPLRDFIERSTSLPAETFGLAGRGRLEPGAFADIVVFNPRRYAERATYEQPTLLAEGVHIVVVNGVLAVDRGALTGAAAGRALAHSPPQGTCP